MKNLHNNVVRILSQSIEYNWLEPYKNKSNNNSVGSGFFINNNGLVLTCCHVLVNTKKVFVEIPTEGKQKYEADIIFICPYFDIGLIQIKNYKNKSFIELYNSEDVYNLEFGSEVFAVGFPLAQNNLKITEGLLSGRNDGLLQTSAPINPGNSGGPLLYKNKVIGINVSKITDASNIGYASPISFYHIIKNNKRNNKLILRPKLGINYINSNEHFNSLHKTKNEGVIITHIFENSPISKTNIKKGDLLISIDNLNIDNYGLTDKMWLKEKMSFNDLTNTLKLNQKINVKYFDITKKKIINETFKFNQFKLNVSKKYPIYDNTFSQHEIIFGIIVCQLNENLLNYSIKNMLENKKLIDEPFLNILSIINTKNREENKLIITHIFPNTELKNLEVLKIYDIITKVNNKKVETIDDFRKQVIKPIISNNKKYVKIETQNNKIVVYELNKLLENEKSNSQIFKYNLSQTFHNLKKTRKNKHKFKKKSKKVIKK